MNKLLLALLLSISASATAGDVTYVGNGRYTCTGSNCESLNAIKSGGRYENVNPTGRSELNDSTRDFIEEQDSKREMEKYRYQLRSESEELRREAAEEANYRAKQRLESEAVLAQSRAEVAELEAASERRENERMRLHKLEVKELERQQRLRKKKKQ